MISHPRPHFAFFLFFTSFYVFSLCTCSVKAAPILRCLISLQLPAVCAPVIRVPPILHSAFLHSAFYQASSPFTSGSTSSRARMPTSIMESSGSKVVKFCSHRPGAVKILVTGPSWRPAQRLNS